MIFVSFTFRHYHIIRYEWEWLEIVLTMIKEHGIHCKTASSSAGRHTVVYLICICVIFCLIVGCHGGGIPVICFVSNIIYVLCCWLLVTLWFTWVISWYHLISLWVIRRFYAVYLSHNHNRSLFLLCLQH